MATGRSNTLYYANAINAKSKDDWGPITEFPNELTFSNKVEDEARVKKVLLERSIMPAFHYLESNKSLCTAAKDNDKYKSRFLKSNLLYADFDDPHFTIRGIQEQCKNVAYIMYVSAHHMKEKKDIICERFKVLFLLNETLRQDRFKIAEQRVQVFFQSDPAGSRFKQKYYPPVGQENAFFYWNDVPGDIRDLVKVSVKHKQRNEYLWQMALELALQGLAVEEIHAKLKAARDSECEDPDDKDINDNVLHRMAERRVKECEKGYAKIYKEFEERYTKIYCPSGMYDIAKFDIVAHTVVEKYYDNNPRNFIKSSDSDESTNVFRTWQKVSNKLAESLEFAPDQKPLQVYHDANGRPIFNTFAGVVQPKKGDCKLILWHVKNIICSKNIESYNWLFNYLAYIYQKPADKERKYCFAIALEGLQGTGKGAFVRYLGLLFFDKKGYDEIYAIKDIIDFNALLKNKIIIHFDDSGSAQWHEASRIIKNLITSVWVYINSKNVEKYALRNHARFFFSTNDAHSVPIERSDRRYVSLEVSREKLGNREYFNDLHYERDNGGLEAFAYVLSQHKVDYALLDNRPKTEAYFDNMLAHISRESTLVAYFADLVESFAESTEKVPEHLKNETTQVKYVDALIDVTYKESTNLPKDKKILDGFVPTECLINKVNHWADTQRSGKRSDLGKLNHNSINSQMKRYFPSIQRDMQRIDDKVLRGFKIPGNDFLKEAMNSLLNIKGDK